MKSRVLQKRVCDNFQYFIYPTSQIIIKKNGDNIFAGWIWDKNDHFAQIPSFTRISAEPITEEEAKDLAPHLFRN